MARNLAHMATGQIIDGVFASEAIDSSGEILDIEGCDISTLDKDGIANYEHREGDKSDPRGGNNGEEIVGKILYAIKIMKESDCETDRQRDYWQRIGRIPFIYGMVRLYDGAGHSGAQALAAQIRDHHANGEPALVRFSIEGATLERKGNRLVQCVARRVALTLKPCNRTAISGLIEDPKAPLGFDKKPSKQEKQVSDILSGLMDDRRDTEDAKKRENEHPSYRRLGGTVELACVPMIKDEADLKQALLILQFAKVAKALDAGSYAGAPSTLTGGAALQREDLRGRAMAALRDYGKKKFDKGEFRAFAKTRLPEANDEFIDHFADIAEDYHVKLKKAASDDRDSSEMRNEDASFDPGAMDFPTGEDDPGAYLDDQPKYNLEKPDGVEAPWLSRDPRRVGGAKKTPAPKKSTAVAAKKPVPKKAASKKASTDTGKEAKIESAPWTIRGVPASIPNVDNPVFDEETGTLHTPHGSFPMYIPSRDPQPGAKESFHNLMNDPKINEFHNYAMHNWTRMNTLLKQGKLPPEVLMHATLFSQLSPNTPVPIQELMYGHLVDSMKQRGVDARSPNFAGLRNDWTGRDRGSQLPEHSRDYYENLSGIRLGQDSYLTEPKPGAANAGRSGENLVPVIDKDGNKVVRRKAGEVASFQLAHNKFKNMAQYHKLHKPLFDLINRHRDDARAGVSEMMDHKIKASNWNAKRQRDVDKGRPDIGEYTGGPIVNGLAPKTARYTYGMLGGGNVHVPDTHFTRYLFGLEKGKDNATIENLKKVLWNGRNSHILEGIDRYYAKHHDAVHHMMQHPQFAPHFQGNAENAIFPSFWKNWVAIAPHERARGMQTGAFNEVTDHRPFWEATNPYVDAANAKLGKSEEDSVDLAESTVKQHHEWVQKYGEVPAMMLYYRHLVPKLLAPQRARDRQATVRKMQGWSIDLRKATHDIQAEKDEAEKNKVEFGGKEVVPGHAKAADGDYDLLHEDHNNFYAVPKGTHPNDYSGKLSRLPKEKQDTHFSVSRRPSILVSDLE